MCGNLNLPFLTHILAFCASTPRCLNENDLVLPWLTTSRRGCFLPLLSLTLTLSLFGRSNAGDRKGLLENDLAGELSQHRDGHQPCGSGPGKPLQLIPGERMWMRHTCFMHGAKYLPSCFSPSQQPVREKSSLLGHMPGRSFSSQFSHPLLHPHSPLVMSSHIVGGK